MSREQFIKISRWFENRPQQRKILIISEKISVLFFYAAYIILLAVLLAAANPKFIKTLLVPAAVFLLGTLLRSALNRPRPYEVWQTKPLVPKNTAGKSFPSRHALSAAVIAAAWLWNYPSAATAVLFGAMLLVVAAVRVIAGVHFVKDVAFGIFFGGFLGYIGFWLL